MNGSLGRLAGEAKVAELCRLEMPGDSIQDLWRHLQKGQSYRQSSRRVGAVNHDCDKRVEGDGWRKWVW